MTETDRSASPTASPSTVRADLLSGFLVFLIALPLCLAIARASNFPPIAGIWTAVIGGLVATWLSNSPLTIKGPAAGLIVIVAGAVTDLGTEFGAGLSDADRMMLGYRLALGVGVAAGVVQVLFGLARVGKLGDFFPLSAVHGMLAAIGIIIIAKQAYIVLGADAPKDAGPLELLAALPSRIGGLNPAIALIGLISLALLFGLPLAKTKWVRKVPAPMVVLLVAVPLGLALDLDHKHTYLFPDNFFDAFGAHGEEGQHFTRHEVGPRFLVDMPEVLANPAAAFALPDFRGLATGVGLKYVLLFALIGSLESLLSAKAIDLLDSRKRKTDLDRDLLAIGVANTLAACVGALPMISEIVRSSANRNNGAETRRANFFHGVFLLAFVLLLPNLIHRIPLAALGAMLVYTGTRLAHPHEFLKTWRIGKEQLAVFVVTIVTTLATDLLIGVAAGVVTEFLFHLAHGMPLRPALRPAVRVEQPADREYLVVVEHTVVFTNWLVVRKHLMRVEPDAAITVDLSAVRYVDHTVMEKLHELAHEFADRGGRLAVKGLDGHRKLSGHPQAARKRPRRAELQVV